jgi:hypothetical protein
VQNPQRAFTDYEYKGTDPVKDYIERKKNEYVRQKTQKEDVVKDHIVDLSDRVPEVSLPVTNQEQDPMDAFGHGIKAYFEMMWALILLFIFFIVLVIPLFVLYSNGGQYDSYSGGALMLGNLGQRFPICMQDFVFSHKQFDVTCNTGTISNLT